MQTIFGKKTNLKIISLDNYSSGFKKNHLKNKRIRYIKANTKDIAKTIPSLFSSAISGSAFARGTTFLKDYLGKEIFSKEDFVDDASKT